VEDEESSAPRPAAVQALVLHPDLDRLGGIEGYYRKVLPHFRVPVESFEVGRRHGERDARLRTGLLRPCADYFRLRRRLARDDAPVVVLNPSLKLDMVLREGLFQRLAKSRGRRTIVFWRGWEPELARTIERRGKAWFRWLFGTTDAFVVLAQEFGEVLRRVGMRQPIHSEVTVVDDAALEGIDIESLIVRRLASRPRTVLFLARLLKPKGIHETLQAMALLAEGGRRDGKAPVRLLVAGDGPELEPARTFARARGLANVAFAGHVSGAAKWDLLRDASVLCLPTQHGEGLPNSIVEAMAFALPVVTTPVGGLADFFRDGVHGFAVAGASPPAIAAALERLLDDEALQRTIGRANHDYARGRFLASQAAARLEALLRSVQKSAV
jgi:glycosyltransferase involved in cell wall biosynthesis